MIVPFQLITLRSQRAPNKTINDRQQSWLDILRYAAPKFIAQSKIPDPENLNEYIIILSDVWLEDKWKRRIPYWWTGKIVPAGFDGWEDKLYKDKITFADYIKNTKKIDWTQGKQIIKKFHAFLTAKCLDNDFI